MELVQVEACARDWLALEEADVEDGRVEVDELKDEHFERQLIFELRLRPVHLCSTWNMYDR